MTEKQRIQECIHFNSRDRVPWQINCTTQLANRLLEEFGLHTESYGENTHSIHRYSKLDDLDV